MLTLDEVERAIRDVALQLPGVSPHRIPDGVNRDGGYPFVRVDGDTLMYLAFERGSPTMHVDTTDLDDLLWTVCNDLARDLAMASTRSPRWSRRRDPRRRWFPRWVQLMTGLRPEWGLRTSAYTDLLLERHPYIDR